MMQLDRSYSKNKSIRLKKTPCTFCSRISVTQADVPQQNLRNRQYICLFLKSCCSTSVCSAEMTAVKSLFTAIEFHAWKPSSSRLNIYKTENPEICATIEYVQPQKYVICTTTESMSSHIKHTRRVR